VAPELEALLLLRSPPTCLIHGGFMRVMIGGEGRLCGHVSGVFSAFVECRRHAGLIGIFQKVLTG